MSYAVATKPFSGPEQCSSSEHWDWETNACAPGLCPAGEHLDASGNCAEGAAPASTSSSSSDNENLPIGPPDYGSSGGGGGATTADVSVGSGGSMAMLAVGLLAVGGIGYWFFRRVS